VPDPARRAPPIGVPTSVANETKKYPTPARVPISEESIASDMKSGVKIVTQAPDAKPYNNKKTTAPGRLTAPSLREGEINLSVRGSVKPTYIA
jgi:hypothetical protein